NSMKMLASLISEDWQKVRDFADPFGIHLGTMGATASEEWFAAYFKSGRDNSVEKQEADTVLLETDISGVRHNLRLVDKETFIALFSDALKIIKEPRFFQTERGYQGELVSAL